MITYVTLFDHGYLDRAIALAHSFACHCRDDLLLLGCMDRASVEILRNIELPATRVLAPEEFIAGDLLTLKPGRNIAEFCWTTKPFLLEYALREQPQAAWVVYLDVDSMIFGPLSTALRQHDAFDCVFTPHNFFPSFADYEPAVGRYNAGFAAFRNSESGRGALTDWRRLCAGSVCATPSANAYGDQKYLEQVVERWNVAPGVAHKGLNVAPWNVGRYRVSTDGTQVLVDELPLLFFHFQGFQRVTSRLTLLYKGNYPLPVAARRLVYRSYLAEIRRATRLIAENGGGALLRFSGLRRSLRAIWAARRNVVLGWGVR